MDNITTKIKVWDAPVRVFHWLLVLSFAGAYLSAESESWRLLHVTLGYTLGGLVAFRLVWGLIGTRYARFANFVRGPQAVLTYLRSLRKGQPQHHLGHNPAGAVAIVLLLLASVAVVGSGWAIYNDVGGEWLSELHDIAANSMLLVVAIHVAGVLVASRLHRENLVRAMVTGQKNGAPADGIRRTRAALAVLLVLAVLGYWWLQWQSAPEPVIGPVSSGSAKYQAHDNDD
jgi:cytochrome b